METLNTRSNGKCEFCGSDSNLAAVPVDTDITSDADTSVNLCDTCAPAAASSEALEGAHWYCLQDAAWSIVPAVQVLCYRLLHRMSGESWTTDLIEQIYLDEETLAWAQKGLSARDDSGVKVVDCNGTALSDGDSVTLIKDLDVKGANFTAKRGTMVKNIRVGDDPTHVEGKVNKTSIMLKTIFLKRA
jgi:protein PhnA